ncbi:NAD(P)-dependent oxidoreductase [Priestia filamentosa]|uniref:NAD(P)-dependent oxidoreductase n=1 Tax=Priestia filamentosa TaxID=1402861 RepID=UPI00234B7877|nr:NAD(P)-dependent oxidoreductase [Priestia filamentosa]WCM14579.1 NAD(P)-dependent oxidoreductase [Priestia filamentosa]
MNILITGAYSYSMNQIEYLKGLGCNVTFVQDERIPLNIDVSQIEVVVCNALFLYTDIKKFINLKFIQLTSAGLDRIPTKYVEKMNIQVANAKGIYSIPMAEWTILRILEFYKNSSFFAEAQKRKKWLKNRNLLELTGKTATIIGIGDVGTEIAKRLKVFNVNVIGVGRREVSSEFIDEYFLVENIETALSKSDITVLTLPLNESTRHLINKTNISKMKEESLLINLSRGGIIEESALIESLDQGKFLGVALDVFEQEPLPEESNLWRYENVTITPHVSFISDKINERLFKLICENLKNYIRNTTLIGNCEGLAYEGTGNIS